MLRKKKTLKERVNSKRTYSCSTKRYRRSKKKGGMKENFGKLVRFSGAHNVGAPVNNDASKRFLMRTKIRPYLKDKLGIIFNKSQIDCVCEVPGDCDEKEGLTCNLSKKQCVDNRESSKDKKIRREKKVIEEGLTAENFFNKVKKAYTKKIDKFLESNKNFNNIWTFLTRREGINPKKKYSKESIESYNDRALRAYFSLDPLQVEITKEKLLQACIFTNDDIIPILKKIFPLVSTGTDNSDETIKVNEDGNTTEDQTPPSNPGSYNHISLKCLFDEFIGTDELHLGTLIPCIFLQESPREDLLSNKIFKLTKQLKKDTHMESDEMQDEQSLPIFRDDSSSSSNSRPLFWAVIEARLSRLESERLPPKRFSKSDKKHYTLLSKIGLNNNHNDNHHQYSQIAPGRKKRTQKKKNKGRWQG